jgi:hypothetical protein
MNSYNLRKQIRYSTEQYAKINKIEYYLSIGKDPTIMFEPYNNKTEHGNFIIDSYKMILNNECWKRRLEKTHPRRQCLPPSKRNKPKELDSSNSSDALLMNIFCYPNVDKFTGAMKLLKLSHWESPCFGLNVQLAHRKQGAIRSEIDMKIGKTIFEAKLTENNFQNKSQEVVLEYENFDKIFNINMLIRNKGKFHNYQLIRNILTANVCDRNFLLLVDSRRNDLIEMFLKCKESIKNTDLRMRCNFITWQELTATLGKELKNFLVLKYGF